jgi:hypothetical protein
VILFNSSGDAAISGLALRCHSFTGVSDMNMECKVGEFSSLEVAFQVYIFGPQIISPLVLLSANRGFRACLSVVES